MRHSTSTPSLTSADSETTLATPTGATPSSSQLAVDTGSALRSPSPSLQEIATPNPVQKAADAAQMLLERTPFAIDEAGDEDDDFDDDVLGDANDDVVMDEVRGSRTLAISFVLKVFCRLMLS